MKETKWLIYLKSTGYGNSEAFIECQAISETLAKDDKKKLLEGFYQEEKELKWDKEGPDQRRLFKWVLFIQ